MSGIVEYISAAPDPFEVGHREHALRVRAFDRTLREVVVSTLEEFNFEKSLRDQVHALGGTAEQMIIGEVCVGSDGREEKGICSPFDLVVYLVNSGLPQSKCFELGEQINQNFRQPEQMRVFESVEAKLMEGRVSCYNGSQDSLWPDRVLDSLVLREENTDITQAARQKLLGEIRDLDQGEFGSRLISRISEKLTKYRRVSRLGSQNAQGGTIEHFSIEKGEAYFDNSTNRHGLGQSSFKQNILRMVQATVNREILHHIRELDDQGARRFILNLPTNMEEKLHFLRDEGVFNRDKLSNPLVEKLVDNYLYFLWLYHQSEHDFFHFQESVIVFDSKVTGERRDDIVELAQRAVKLRKK